MRVWFLSHYRAVKAQASLCKCAYLPEPFLLQGSHRLEKYLNIQDCLKKSLKIKFALKTLKGLEKSLNFSIYRRIQQCF